MMRYATWALAAAFGAGLAPTANAQEFHRDFDQMAAASANDEDSFQLRLSLPFGKSQSDQRNAALALNFANSMGNGEFANLNLLSLSFGDTPRLVTPLALNAADDGEGGWLSNPRNQILLGIGAGLVIWAIVDANQDDGDSGPPPPT